MVINGVGVGAGDVCRAGGVVTTGRLDSTFGAGEGGAMLDGGGGALVAGNVSLTSAGAIETSFWLSQTRVNPSAAMSVAANAVAGSSELRLRLRLRLPRLP